MVHDVCAQSSASEPCETRSKCFYHKQNETAEDDKNDQMKIGLQRDARASALNWIRVYWLCDSSSR